MIVTRASRVVTYARRVPLRITTFVGRQKRDEDRRTRPCGPFHNTDRQTEKPAKIAASRMFGQQKLPLTIGVQDATWYP